MAHFKVSLSASGRWPDVLVMTYSEFGRGAAEISRSDNDHGTVAPHFMFGGSVRGALFEETPELSRLVDVELTFTSDFRDLYSTVSRDWF